MKRFTRSERGIALLIAIFALLLLSAVGLSMMFSADTETSINANFRTKQQVNYAALSGALEARDRLQPSKSTSIDFIPFPTDAPNTTTPQVWYIINPGTGETATDIQPWDASNKYADTELCHETGAAATFGLSCSSSPLPTSTTWYTPKDNSSYGGTFGLANPLLFKWARIQLKTDNSGPVPVGSSPSGQVVCWDGRNQLPQPVGFGKNCRPVGGMVGKIDITNAGSGYTSGPTVTLSGGGGSGAQATAEIETSSTGSIASIQLTNPGSGYSTAPTVAINGDGTGATATAIIYGGTVTAVNLTSSTTANTMCYQTPPSVAISGGGGNYAQATAVLDANSSCVYAISGGNCHVFAGNTYDVTVKTGGNDAIASVTFDPNNGKISAASIKTPGTGYTTLPNSVTLNHSGTDCTNNQTLLTLGKRVASFNITNGGTGYSSTPTVTIAPGVGTNASAQTAVATVVGNAGGQAGQIAAINVTAGGSNYTTATVTISGGGGSNGAATATIGTTGKLKAITVTNGGSNYTSAPSVTLGGGGCTSNCGTATAYLASGVIYGQVLQITSLAMSRNGSRAMTQMEVATPPAHQLGITGALTLAGPAVDADTAFNPPLYNSTNSQNFQIVGNDKNSCGATQAYPSLPAVGVYDDPNNPTNPTAQAEVTDALGKPQNYYGSKPAPDVEDIYASLGDTNSPSSMEAFTTTIVDQATQVPYPSGTPSTVVNMGTPTAPAITVVNGDLTIGPGTTRDGYGILLVRGTLTIQGNFTWHGLLYVIGQGQMQVTGGGNGEVDGSVIIAKTRDSSGNLLATLGTPSLDWRGGGGNGIYYDHCWADDMLSKIPFNPGPTTQPLRILSTRTVTY